MEIRKRKRRLPLHKSITEAGRLIGRRLAVSKQLFRESGPRFLENFWNRSHSSQAECDVVLTLPASTDQILLEWLLRTFEERLPHLIVRLSHHGYFKLIMLSCTADMPTLLRGAEELHVRKRVRSEFGGGFKEFCCDDPFGIWEERDIARFLSTQERQEIVMYFLNSMRTEARDTVRGKLLLEGQSLIQRLRIEGIIEQIYPLHEEEPLRNLKTNWVNRLFDSQPLDDVANYFGVKIAMYFGWLGHYTTALFFPAIMGLCIWISCYGKDQRHEDLCFILFALLNVVWATLYLESWKRKSSELAHMWGTLDVSNEMLSVPRPLFKGQMVKSPVTGRMEPRYPKWKRNLFRYLVTLPVISLCLVVVLGVMLLMLQLQTWTDKRYRDDSFKGWMMSMLPKILFALIIPITDTVYKKIAVWLNDKENYRLEESYENHLIMKISVFQFVNSFLSLFYIAFYLQDMDKLKDQLAALLITRQVVGNIKESLVPYIVETLCLAEMTSRRRASAVESNAQDQTHSDTAPDAGPSQAEVEAAMYRYDGTFEDYLEMFIQFGYVVLFSSAFPLAALCAFVNNVVEIRSDAFKLCAIFQRPFGQPAENIGTWQDAMEIMGMLAVVVNCTLVGLNGQLTRMWPSLGKLETIIIVVIVEHLLLLLKFAIAFAIPDVPHWVQIEMAKAEFQRREAAKHHQQGIYLSTELESEGTQTDPTPLEEKSVQTGVRRRSETASSSPPTWRRGLSVIGQSISERF
ncbi:anoctamin-8 [Galendromus occidentalis]|uniref:Anoctamin n=1 Tax=Galendromus occidentalis TaxID=34638 RepID=A0AAJ6QUF4_9ACAR|nr:anoctamin-8 [Galendromus occidentalis]